MFYKTINDAFEININLNRSDMSTKVLTKNPGTNADLYQKCFDYANNLTITGNYELFLHALMFISGTFDFPFDIYHKYAYMSHPKTGPSLKGNIVKKIYDYILKVPGLKTSIEEHILFDYHVPMDRDHNLPYEYAIAYIYGFTFTFFDFHFSDNEIAQISSAVSHKYIITSDKKTIKIIFLSGARNNVEKDKSKTYEFPYDGVGIIQTILVMACHKKAALLKKLLKKIKDNPSICDSIMKYI